MGLQASESIMAVKVMIMSMSIHSMVAREQALHKRKELRRRIWEIHQARKAKA